MLEEEVALANIALDLLGQARVLLSLAGDEDELAYLREERAFRNLQLVEQPNGDFAHTIARQLYFSTYQELLYGQLADGDGEFAPLAAKAVKEVAYHRDHAEQWTLRLGDGTDGEPRPDAARRWTPCGATPARLFEPVEGLARDLARLCSDSWLDVHRRRPGAGHPDRARRARGAAAWSAGAGRQGLHTEPFGRMLAEMQHLHRSHPGATW